MIPLKDTLIEVILNCKVGLIGSGIMIAAQTVVELSGERYVRYAMLYIGLTVGILTIVKLLFELGPAYRRFKDSLEKRKERKQREKNH